jgi:hypothetical protein
MFCENVGTYDFLCVCAEGFPGMCTGVIDHCD